MINFTLSHLIIFLKDFFNQKIIFVFWWSLVLSQIQIPIISFILSEEL